MMNVGHHHKSIGCNGWGLCTYDIGPILDLIKRDKVNLDLFWLKDQSLEDSENLPESDVLAQEIADDLQTALDQFMTIAGTLREE